MSNFQDNPGVGHPNNKFDGENETPFKWAYEMDKTQFKYRCPCKKGYHAHGNGGDPHTNRVEHRSSHCAMYSGEKRVLLALWRWVHLSLVSWVFLTGCLPRDLC